MYTYIYMYIYVSLSMYMCIYTHICMRTFTYIYIFILNPRVSRFGRVTHVRLVLGAGRGQLELTPFDEDSAAVEITPGGPAKPSVVGLGRLGVQ